MYIYFRLMNHKQVFVNFTEKKVSLKIEISLAHVICYSGIYLNRERPVNTRNQLGVRIDVLYIVCFFNSLKKLYETMSV